MNEDNIRRLEHISVHYVRNKMNGEGMVLSESELELDPDMTILLKDFFLTPFKSDVYYQFYDEDALENNAVFSIASKIFEKPEFCHEESKIWQSIFIIKPCIAILKMVSFMSLISETML